MAYDPEWREMQKALEADGEKLRRLTGEDHGPFYLDKCPECGGAGVIIKGCWDYNDVEEIPCPDCDGSGLRLTGWEPSEIGGQP